MICVYNVKMVFILKTDSVKYH